ncbi:hypothetical protein [Niveispirillum sp. SYP-B3756]|uniref:hypothetical protein n=1 Tax=Niveispirillum sp. SYP-B3756 TaxID=2662178 RepID=UPI001B3C09F3|nr:hypothetical protein [Niveispirillum sp. SYP-B3756]
MTDHPPKPRLSLSVAITGHRPNRLPEHAQAGVALALEGLLQRLAAATHPVLATHATLFSPQPPRLTLLSALAEGADRLAAEAALAQGWGLEVVLPFAQEEYAADFTEAGALEAFQALLARADAVLEWPGKRDRADLAYEAAGLTLLDHADLLIAVWDGGPAAGRGGTGEIMQAAVRRGMPVIIVDATGQRSPELRWTSRVPYPRPAAFIEDLPGAGTEDLTALVDDLLAPPASTEADGRPDPHGEVEHLATYLQEKRCGFHGRPEWHLLHALALVRRPRRTDLHSRSPEACTSDLQGRPAYLPAITADAFGWADALATHYAQIFRSAFVANFLFAALSVFGVALSLLVIKSLNWLGDEMKWTFVLAELLLISLVLLNTGLGHRTNWHRRWLEAREVAERLRVAVPMIGLGCRPAGGHGRARIWTGWYSRALLRASGLPPLRFTADVISSGREGLATLLRDQCSYHQTTHQRLHRMEHRLELFGEVLFHATLIIVILYLAAVGGDHLWLDGALEHGLDEISHDLWHRITYGVTAATVGLPVLATAAYGIRLIADFEGNASRSHRMASELDQLLAALAKDDPADLPAAQDRARQAAEIMLGDVANWRLAAEGRGLAKPG